MGWNEILGHDEIVEQFRRAVGRDRLASTFLFVGPDGVGKRTFAHKLAQTLLCERAGDSFEACGECPACMQVRAATHPDVIEISKPEEKSVIPVDLLIGDREHRMRAGLCHQISLTPYSGKRKIAIIDDADYLGIEGANCLLKTLEEPPGRSILILIGVSVQRQLPTILSRCQIVHFRPLSTDHVQQLLREKNLLENPEEADIEALAAASGGSLTGALENADAELQAFRRQLAEDLSQPHWNALELAQQTSKFVDAAGKDAPKRRHRLRKLAGFIADYYRALMMRLAGTPQELPAELEQLVSRAADRWPADQEAAAQCTLRTLETLDHVAASGNMATLLECWFDDLYRRTHPSRGRAG